MNYLVVAFFSISAFSQSFFGSSFYANYEETGTSFSGKKIKTVGRIDYKYPSHLKMEISKPDHTVLVINKNQHWYYQAPVIETEKGVVTIDKDVSFPILKIFDSIHSGLKDSDIYTYLNDGKEISLILKEKSKKELGVEKIVLKSSKGTKDLKKLSQVEELTIFKSSTDFKVMKFLDFKDNIDFDKDHFVFQIPVNTKIQKK